MAQEPLSITDIGTDGDGIARVKSGSVVFVPFAAAGDMVMANVTRDQDGQLRAKIDSFLLKSPMRQNAPCRHFGICGGCALQHINPQSYQDFKKRNVIDALAKQNIPLPEQVETIFIPPHTRRRANFAARVIKGKTIIGFHERRSATIRDVPDCWLITEDVRRVMELFRPYLRDIAGEGAKMDVLIQCFQGQSEIGLTGKLAPGWEAQQALADALRTVGLARISLRARDYDPYEILLEEKPYFAQFDSLSVNLAPGAFLQPSDEGEAALTKCVMEGVGDASRAADLFCGNGTFTGPLMNGRDVIAVDFTPDAIASLQAAGVKAVNRNLFTNPMLAEELSDRDVVILDPPRAGAMAQVNVLAGTHIPKIVYVSCSPQSFAKDAAILLGGGYKLGKLTIVDQFVWSAHTEIVGIFEKSLT